MGSNPMRSIPKRQGHALTLLLFACMFCTCAPAASAQQKKLKLVTTETSFGKLPAGARADQLFFSPDVRHVAAVAKRRDGALVWSDGVEGRLYEWVLPKSLVWSPDGSRLAFNVQRGDHLFVVIGADEHKPYADVSHVTFGRDGRRFAYTAKISPTSTGVVTVLDGVEGKEYPAITAQSLTFSPDGRRFACRVEADNKEFWVIDGQEMQAYDRVGPLAFSNDGARFAYSAETGGKQQIVTDRADAATKTYDAAGGVSFSPDGKRIAYAARRGNKQFAVIDGVEGTEYDRVAEPQFNSTGTRVAYEAVRDRRVMVVVDGQEQASYDAISEARFSADGEHVGYRAVQDRRFLLVIDGKESEPFDRIHAWQMSPDGRRIAFGARAGVEDFLVLDGKRIPGPGHLTMSPDGRYVAHSRPTGKSSVLMVNDTDGPAYDGFLAGSRWVFHAPNKLTCMAGRNGEIVRVDVEILEE